MGERKIIVDGEIEGPPVVKVSNVEDDNAENGEPAVHVTTVPIGDGASTLERYEQDRPARAERS